MKKFLAVIALLILASFALLTTKCAVIYHKHNAEARELLVKLRRLPLPQGARLLYERDEAGSFLSSTGDSTDIIAYRIFISDLPGAKVTEFFQPYMKPGEFDSGVCPVNKPPAGSPYLPMRSILGHIPDAERNHAYILYQTDRCEEDGIWDIRGW